MTPQRLDYLIEQCLKRNGRPPKDYGELAAFLHVTQATLHRWLAGTTPIPRGVELFMEAKHAWPDLVTADALTSIIEQRDQKEA